MKGGPGPPGTLRCHHEQGLLAKGRALPEYPQHSGLLPAPCQLALPRSAPALAVPGAGSVTLRWGVLRPGAYPAVRSVEPWYDMVPQQRGGVPGGGSEV